MYIDVHAHVFHPKIANKVLSQLEHHYGIIPEGSGLTEDLLARIDESQLEKAVVLTAATSPDQVVPANNWALHIQKTYPQLIPFGTIHPDYDGMEAELNRLHENGIVGLKFHPDFQGYWLNDNRLYDVMEMIGDRFVCLFHVGDKLAPEENPSCPKKLAALHAAFPKPTMIAAHMGGYRHWEYALEFLATSNILVDTSSTMRFVSDDLLKKLFNTFGKDRLLFGSDYPLFDPAEEIEQMKSRLHLSNTEMSDILSNASNLFLGNN